MYKEEQILKYQDKGHKLELVKLTNTETPDIIRYQVRLNRKRIKTSISEYQMRKLFTIYTQNIVLQLKIY